MLLFFISAWMNCFLQKITRLRTHRNRIVCYAGQRIESESRFSIVALEASLKPRSLSRVYARDTASLCARCCKCESHPRVLYSIYTRFCVARWTCWWVIPAHTLQRGIIFQCNNYQTKVSYSSVERYEIQSHDLYVMYACMCQRTSLIIAYIRRVYNIGIRVVIRERGLCARIYRDVVVVWQIVYRRAWKRAIVMIKDKH